MYFPTGWPRQLACQDDGSPLIHVSSNPDRLLFVILTHKTITIWYCKPSVQIVSFRRSDNSVSQFGENQKAQWKPDSSMIAITTSKGYIIFFRLEVETKGKNTTLFVQREDRKSVKNEPCDIGAESIPALHLHQTAYIQVAGGVHSMLCLREELMVATGIGWLQRIRWDGMINGDMTIEISSIPFSVDLQQSRASQLTASDEFVKQLQYSPLMGGFAVVLASGKAAFITASSLKFEPHQVVGVWAQEVREATAVAVNHKYTLMAFGFIDGGGLVYHLDDTTGSLVVSHKLVVSSKDFPDCRAVCGSVSSLKWTPDGQALAMTWEKGGFSLWSVFGSLLLHSLHVDMGESLTDSFTSPHVRIKSLEWGSEGYHMWLVSEVVSDDSPKPTDANHTHHVNMPKLLQLSFVKSALSVNPCMSNREHLFLQGEDKLYLNTEDNIPKWPNNGDSGQAAFLMNKQWQIVPIPHAYLTQNWPIRFASVNRSGHLVAVAGKTGLAHYALFSRRWKLFGNETQERDMVVSGGLTWWKDFLLTACYNLLDQRDEVRFYPRECKLDNRFSEVVKVPSQILLLNTFHDVLVILCADCHLMLFKLNRVGEKPNPTIEVVKVQEVAVGNFIPHPATVISVTLTTIRTETATVRIQPQNTNEVESIILNVAGRLLMFQKDRSGLHAKPKERGSSKERPLPFCAPVMVASSVENMWYCSHRSNHKPHLTEALWLSCGVAGMKVWLPLHPKDDGVQRGFMSRRIMLPFRVDVYPLAVVFESGILLGASSESQSYHSCQNVVEEGWSFFQLERTNQVYLHHVLRQLLRRNLGVHALEVARSCRDLQFFAHILELLIHEVLDEEATSKEPIPDPLLPRVVAFVQEFPEFFQVIAHSARKTEVALWQYFFSTVGSPKDLFRDCLEHNELETAASYLIILQNMEKPVVARQHATLLLDASLDQCSWDLARDLVRFLKAIDPSEADSPLSASKSRMGSNSVYTASYPSPPLLSPEEGSQFVYPTPQRGRTTSLMNDEKEAVKPREKNKLTKSESLNSSSNSKLKRTPSGHKDDPGGTAEQFFIDSILNRHARKLLSAYKLRDLASFAANLEDYQLVSWLRKEKLRAARVEDSVAALKKLHEDFRWPLPILSLSELHRLASQSSLSSYAGSDVKSNGDGSSRKGPLTSSPSSSSFHKSVSQSSINPSSEGAAAAEVLLKRNASRGASEDSSVATMTEGSDTNSLAADTEMTDSTVWADSFCLTELEQLSHELANKGPQQSEVELRFLYQLMVEAGCFEWALMIAVVLRDALSVVRVANTCSMTDTPIEIVGRMREGLSFLELWADTECFGYKPFLQSVSAQTRQLDQIIEANLPSSRLSLGRLRHVSTSSTDSGRTLEQQASMEREITLEDSAGLEQEDLEGGVGGGGSLELGKREGSTERRDSGQEDSSEEREESTDDGSCTVS